MKGQSSTSKNWRCNQQKKKKDEKIFKLILANFRALYSKGPKPFEEARRRAFEKGFDY